MAVGQDCPIVLILTYTGSFVCFLVLPAILLQRSIRKLAWGGERETAWILLLMLCVSAYIVVAPSAWNTLNLTPLSSIVDLQLLRDGGCPSRMLAALYDLPFSLGASDIGTVRFVPLYLGIVSLIAIFVIGTTGAGPVGGVVAGMLVLVSSRFLDAMRVATDVPVIIAGSLLVFAVMIRMKTIVGRCLLVAVGFVGLRLVLPKEALPLGFASSGLKSFFYLGCFGAVAVSTYALRWCTKGLKRTFIEWSEALAIGTVLFLAVVVMQFPLMPGSSSEFSLVLFVEILLSLSIGIIVGGFWRFFRGPSLLVPIVLCGAVAAQGWLVPRPRAAVVGFRATVDDLKSVLGNEAILISSIDPNLLTEFLNRPVYSMQAFLDGQVPEANNGQSVLFETRFVAIGTFEQLQTKVRLVPVLPGLWWKDNVVQNQLVEATE